MKKERVNSSEIRAYFHQRVEELSIFLTPDTEIFLTEMPVKSSIKKSIENGDLPEDFKAKFCYVIEVIEDGTSIKGTGFGNHEFEAISSASNTLYKQFEMITNESISTTDHLNEVQSYINGEGILH